MAELVPARSRAVQLPRFGATVAEAIEALRVVERPTPVPRRGQVLIRIEAAPCNPSDLLLLQGKYGRMKTLPTVPGWEGAGTVIASGGGFLANWIRGRRVACAVQGDQDGTWAEHVVANARECIPLSKKVTTEQGASLIINPMTALGLVENARRQGHRAAVHTAGASQLGRMLLPIAREAGFPLVNVVRRPAQVELLKSLGAADVLCSADAEFAEQLKAACHRLQATAAFEAVAGDMTGTVLGAMPGRATVYLFGALSETACGSIDPIDLIFHGKTVTGFFLGDWLRQRGALRALSAANRIQRMLAAGQIATHVQRRLSLDEAVDGLKQYVTHMTDGKVLLVPHKR